MIDGFILSDTIAKDPAQEAHQIVIVIGIEKGIGTATKGNPGLEAGNEITGPGVGKGSDHEVVNVVVRVLENGNETADGE